MSKAGNIIEVSYSNIIGTNRVDVEINGKEPTNNVLHGDSLHALYQTENERVSQDKA